MKKLLLPALGIFLLALQPGCETEIPSPDTSTYHYRIPGKLGDGWEVGSLEDAAIDSVPLIRMMNDMIEYPGHGIHSILIVRDNRIVFEEYFPGKDLYSPYRIFRPETLHCLCSVTKTFTSALAGIALREGILQSVNDSVCKYLPAYDSLFVGYRRQITIRDLLTLSSGIRWDEHSTAYSDTLNDLGNTIAHEDPISYILSRPVDHEPGTRFNYSGGDVILLGELIARAAGKSLDEFAGQYLFGPLGIGNSQWFHLAGNVTYASGDLHLRPRDMAKFGQLYLDKGSWQNHRVLDETYVNESQLVQAPDRSYGYNWWINENWAVHTKAAYAGGRGGQFIFLFREFNTVVVFTGGNFDSNGDTPVFNRLNTHILPALTAF